MMAFRQTTVGGRPQLRLREVSSVPDGWSRVQGDAHERQLRDEQRLAFEAWRAANPTTVEPPRPSVLLAEDGSRWVLDAAGVPRKAGQ